MQFPLSPSISVSAFLPPSLSLPLSLTPPRVSGQRNEKCASSKGEKACAPTDRKARAEQHMSREMSSDLPKNPAQRPGDLWACSALLEVRANRGASTGLSPTIVPDCCTSVLLHRRIGRAGFSEGSRVHRTTLLSFDMTSPEAVLATLPDTWTARPAIAPNAIA